MSEHIATELTRRLAAIGKEAALHMAMQQRLKELRLLDYELDGYVTVSTWGEVPEVTFNFSGYTAPAGKRRPDQTDEDYDIGVKRVRADKAARDMALLVRQLVPLVGRWDKDTRNLDETVKIVAKCEYGGMKLVLECSPPSTCKIEYEDETVTVPARAAEPERVEVKRKVKVVDCRPLMSQAELDAVAGSELMSDAADGAAALTVAEAVNAGEQSEPF